MATIIERYRVAVHSDNLAVDERTTYSDSDVIGAMGLADRRLTEGYVRTGPDTGYKIPESPLTAPLQRLLSGDNHAAHQIVSILAQAAWSRAEYRRIKPRVTRTMAHDMACACLAWYRHGTCRSCGGHGYSVIPGAPMLSERHCEPCEGTGKVPFERQFSAEHVNLARWLVVEMERSLSRAAPAAMGAIAEKMEF